MDIVGNDAEIGPLALTGWSEVKINVRPSFAVRWLIPRLPNFMALHPDIQPEVVTSTLAPDQSREVFDIVIRRGQADWSANVLAQLLLEDEIVMVAAPSLIQTLPLDDVSALDRHTLLSGKTRSADWKHWAEHVGIAQLPTQATLQFDHMHLVLQAAVDGMGIALCPASLLGKDLSTGRLVCPLPELRMPLMRYYYGVSQDAAPDTQVFIDWMFTQIDRDAIEA